MNKIFEYKISVIIPLYSVGPTFLNEAIESIKKQKYSNWEIILVDDCSPQQEWKIEIVNNLIKDHKLKLINNQKNLGPGVSRNIGFDNSDGDIILFLDSDDKYSKNNFFEYLNLKFQELPDLDVLHFQFENFLWNNKKQIYEIEKEINMQKIQDSYFKKMKIDNFLENSKFSVNTWIKVYKKSFLIRNNIRHLNKNTWYEDWVFWFQIISKTPNLFFTNEKFYLYRKRKNSIMWKTKKSKYWDVNFLKIVKNDIEEYINRGGDKVKLNYQKVYFLSEPIFALILKYGIKNVEKNCNINKNILKQILYEWKKKTSKKTKIIINLKFIGRIIYKIFILLKK